MYEIGDLSQSTCHFLGVDILLSPTLVSAILCLRSPTRPGLCIGRIVRLVS